MTVVPISTTQRNDIEGLLAQNARDFAGREAERLNAAWLHSVAVYEHLGANEIDAAIPHMREVWEFAAASGEDRPRDAMLQAAEYYGIDRQMFTAPAFGVSTADAFGGPQFAPQFSPPGA